MTNKKKGYIGLFGIGIGLVLWYLLYVWMQVETEEGAQSVHLEWNESSVSWNELYQARENETKGAGIFFYLWKQEEGSVRNPETGQETEAALITGLGDMKEALPVRLLSGTYLNAITLKDNQAELAKTAEIENVTNTANTDSADTANSTDIVNRTNTEDRTDTENRTDIANTIDKEGCLVSQGTAEALWGNQDVVGQPMEAGGRQLIVRGVTKEKKAKVYLCPEAESWKQEKQHFLEVYTTPEAAAAETARTQKALAESFLARHGIREADSSTDYLWQSGIKLTGVRLIAVLFFVLLMKFYILPDLYRCFGRTGKRIELLSGMVILLLSLKWVFQDFVIPEDWIPPAWSDFDFWGEKWREL